MCCGSCLTYSLGKCRLPSAAFHLGNAPDNAIITQNGFFEQMPVLFLSPGSVTQLLPVFYTIHAAAVHVIVSPATALQPPIASCVQ